MNVPYKFFDSGERLPFVTLTLAGPRNKIQLDAFVDSGADFSIFHYDFINDLGFPKKNATVRKVEVGDGDHIDVMLFNVSVDFYGTTFSTPISFSKQLGPNFNLLGRRGFFNRFRFCFDDKNYRLTLSSL